MKHTVSCKQVAMIGFAVLVVVTVTAWADDTSNLAAQGWPSTLAMAWFFGRKKSPRDADDATAPEPDHTESALDKRLARQASPPSQLDQLIQQTLAENRCARLLTPTVGVSLHGRHLEDALDALQQAMAVVPQGPLSLSTGLATADDYQAAVESCADEAETAQEVVQVEAFYLDRFAVTNQQFKQFLDAGGYEQMEHWLTQIWPAVVDFVDRSGRPGPRFWQDGTFAEGKQNHPVVGVSWYEAAAYAHWVGKRLPQDAEWVKTGSWPVEVVPGQMSQRRFPWGDSMDRSLANLWTADIGDTTAVDDYRRGVSVGGVYQLIGNVWEWTTDVVHCDTDLAARDNGPLGAPMMSIRGAAFDTYFESQATCHFRSAERPIARKHNIGFRCALSAADVIGLPENDAAPAASVSIHGAPEVASLVPVGDPV